MEVSQPHLNDDVSDVFPRKPENVPPKLAAATAKYKWHAWLAMGGLFLFGLFYIGLTAWFGWATYQQLFVEAEMDGLLAIIKGVCAAILTIFLVKGLFFKKSSGGGGGFQVTAEDQPRLFDFLNRVADEAGAPRPHKVYLSASVNACVFYDLSLINFIFPTRKNLDIGLGLINVVTLSEFKAVLAHEFGHFAQRSMAVGRWVYTAQQVATQLIYHRDGLDKFLNVISGIDLRIAWIGWLLRLVVWALRSILDSMLSLVMLAERALSREMEFQADLVAVSTTGSDALIHGLFRLPAADQAWQEATGFIDDQLSEGFKTEDVFAIQSWILEKQQYILNDPDFGSVPPMPADGRDQHRIFTADIAQPPQMWATHPQSHLREANAKATYVPADLDDRSAWLVFEKADQLRKDLSAFLLKELEQKDRPMEKTIEALDKSYRKEYFNPAYRGVYLNRSIVSQAEKLDDLYLPQGSAHPVGADLYPESITDELERMRNLYKEKSQLEALRDRRLETADGIIRFRGEIIKRSGLGSAIEQSSADFDQYNEKLCEHDRRCRSYHMTLAQSMGEGWSLYLRGLLSALHYADHSLRDLSDANRKLGNTYQVVIADGNVSNKERNRLVADAYEVYRCLRDVYEQKINVQLDDAIRSRLKVSGWRECLEDKLGLPRPDQNNIGDWLQASGGWIGATCHALNALREAALEELLKTEAQLREAHQTEVETPTLPQALPATSVPTRYKTMLVGDERELQTKLNAWDSFQTASGVGPALFRFLVAFAIVVFAVYITLPPDWARMINSLLGLI